MSESRFALSFRLRHPSMRSDLISKALQAEPRRQWSSGDERTTPSGMRLGGTRRDSYWSQHLSDTSESSPTEQIGSHLPQIEKHSEFLKSFVDTGGSVEYFIGWFGG